MILQFTIIQIFLQVKINKNLKSNYGERFAYTLEIKTEGNSTYAILSYGDKVKAKLTGEVIKVNMNQMINIHF